MALQETREPAAAALPDDALKVLSWLRQRRGEGRPRIFSIVEIARGVFPRLDGPAPGQTFDPAVWGRLNRALALLSARGMIEQGRLPQGDAGYRLTNTG